VAVSPWGVVLELKPYENVLEIRKVDGDLIQFDNLQSGTRNLPIQVVAQFIARELKFASTLFIFVAGLTLEP